MLSGPEITGAGVGMMRMFLLTELSQPNDEVCFTETIPVPAAPHKTVILLPVLLPLMVPPLAVQLYVLPAIAVMLYVDVRFEQMLSGPEITGAGVGIMRIDLLIELSQPKPDVCFTVTLPVPAAPHNIVMLLPVLLPLMVPPVAVQL